MDSAIDAWRKAADAAFRMGNLKQAAVTLENAGREVVSISVYSLFFTWLGKQPN